MNNQTWTFNRRKMLAAAPAMACAAVLPGRSTAALTDAVALPKHASTAIDALAQHFVADGNVDGLSVAVLYRGTTRFFNAGVVSQSSRVAATERHVYEIGSVSKTFTALILAHAVLEGRVALQDPVQKFLPGRYDNLVRDGRSVTFADIVTTTSALPDNVPDWLAVAPGAPPKELIFAASKFLRDYPYENFLSELAKAQLIGKPGTAPRHSNAASVLLGVLLERIYGQSYSALLSQIVERPMKLMPGTGDSRAALQVSGYGADDTPRPTLRDRVMLAAAGLQYSAVDMARYLSAQIAASSPAIALTQRPLFKQSDSESIAFHWTVARTADSNYYLRHSGGTFGCSCYCDFYPAQRYGIALLANRVTRTTQDDLQKMANAVQLAIFGAPQGLTKLERALENSDYGDVPGTIASVRREHGELFLSEQHVNDWGYQLLKAGRPKAALGLFAYNAAAHPGSWNAHDSFGEALAANGDTRAAITEYRRSVELNPENKAGIAILQKLQSR